MRRAGGSEVGGGGGQSPCRKCGTCCTAPDISTLAKPVGVRCMHLSTDGLCAVYDSRPDVCRNYLPDDTCREIEAPTLAERVANFLRIYGLDEEKCQSEG